MKRLIKYTIIIPALITLISCKSAAIHPFAITVSDYNYSLSYSVKYKLTDKNLEITFIGELENEKDSMLYSTDNLPQNKLRKISQIDIDALKDRYKNDCIADGDIKVFNFKKGEKTKRIQVNNYYQKDLSSAVELINSIVPEKFKMYHDKTALLAGQKWCEEDRKTFLENKKT